MMFMSDKKTPWPNVPVKIYMFTSRVYGARIAHVFISAIADSLVNQVTYVRVLVGMNLDNELSENAYALSRSTKIVVHAVETR